MNDTYQCKRCNSNIKTCNRDKHELYCAYSLKKDELRPTLMDDKSLSLNNFVEKVLDHCKFSTLKGVKSSDDKRLKFSKRETCYVRYVNYTKFIFKYVNIFFFFYEIFRIVSIKY